MNDGKEQTISREEVQRLEGLFHPRIISGGYFQRRVEEYDQRRPLALQCPDLDSHSTQDLAICDRCDLVYQITPSRDIMFEDQDGISVPYCEPCAITRALREL